MMTTPQVLAALDGRITFRQLDHWIRTGAISIGYGRARGSGNRRTFTPAEVAALKAFATAWEMNRTMTELLHDGSVWADCLARQRPRIVRGGL